MKNVSKSRPVQGGHTVPAKIILLLLTYSIIFTFLSCGFEAVDSGNVGTELDSLTTELSAILEELKELQVISDELRELGVISEEMKGLKDISLQLKELEVVTEELKELEVISEELEKLDRISEELKTLRVDLDQVAIDQRVVKTITWKKDGVQMVLIPEGSFKMGDHFNEGEASERPVHTVELEAFYMDAYEVTNDQYAKFLNEYESDKDKAGHRFFNLKDSDIVMDGEKYKSKAGLGNYPVTQVSWYGAAAYAQFYSKRLPTEAEWEKAARGKLIGQRYPWSKGNSITHDDANYTGKGGADQWNLTPAPVGSFPPNGYGLYDMAGNVGEWCIDEYSAAFYVNSPKSKPVAGGLISFVNNNFVDVRADRVIRGGNWFDEPVGLRVAGRSRGGPDGFSGLTGFRCVDAQ